MTPDVSEQGEVVTLKLSGSIGTEESEVLQEIMMKKISQDARNKFILDLSNVAIIGSSGLGVIVSIYKKISSNGGFIKIKKPNQTVQKILRTTKIDTIIDIE